MFHVAQEEYKVQYLPAEFKSGTFGGKLQLARARLAAGKCAAHSRMPNVYQLYNIAVLGPTAAVLLLYLFQTDPMVSAGFFLVAVCPAAPFAPLLTAMAKDDVHVSVGLTVIFAASSAILAPILLSFLLPLMVRGANLEIDMFKIVTTLLMTQILPLGIGMLGRSGLLKYAEKLQRPATLLSVILSLVVFALIISLQYRTLAEIRLMGFVRISVMVLLCLATRSGCVRRSASLPPRETLALHC